MQPTLTLHTGASTGLTLYGWECRCGQRGPIRYATEAAAQMSALRHVETHATAPAEAQKDSHDQSQL